MPSASMLVVEAAQISGHLLDLCQVQKHTTTTLLNSKHGDFTSNAQPRKFLSTLLVFIHISSFIHNASIPYWIEAFEFSV